MSAALVRQALEFVDPDESKIGGKRKRGSRSRGIAGQEAVTQIETKPIKKQATKRSTETVTQEVISKLLKLSETTVNKEISQKIVKRVVTGKPLFEKIKVKKEVQKSILFPEDDLPKKKKKNKKRY